MAYEKREWWKAHTYTNGDMVWYVENETDSTKFIVSDETNVIALEAHLRQNENTLETLHTRIAELETENLRLIDEMFEHQQDILNRKAENATLHTRIAKLEKRLSVAVDYIELVSQEVSDLSDDKTYRKIMKQNRPDEDE